MLSVEVAESDVLILIVMDNGLLQDDQFKVKRLSDPVLILIVMDNGLLQIVTLDPNKGLKVLILIVMDNGLLLFDGSNREFNSPLVLILIVMDNGLLHPNKGLKTLLTGLNPYCNG